MAKRKALGKRTRFEIFKRDGFRCRYCGADPVKTVLHVDHIVAVANGGTNDPANLITSCRECNSGKGAVPLEARAYSSSLDAKIVREQVEQIKAYLLLQKELAEARLEATCIVREEWEARVGPMSQDMFNRLPGLMAAWPHEMLTQAMGIVGMRMGSVGAPFSPGIAENQAKYFHGILRNWKRDRGGA